MQRRNKNSLKYFEPIYKVLLIQPWLEQKRQYIEDLIHSECISDLERQLIVDLLVNFTFLETDQISRFSNIAADLISNKWKLKESNTRILGLTHDYEPDSSPIILYTLRTKLFNSCWYSGRNKKFFTKFDTGLKKFKDDEKSINIVLVDEFIGSGNTIIGRIKEAQAVLNNNESIDDYTFHVCVLAGMEEGINLIQKMGINTFILHELKKGISDILKSQKQDDLIKSMLRLESILEHDMEVIKKRLDFEPNLKEFPSFGYGKAEALYARDEGGSIANTPNSVFPIFWWRFLNKSEDLRETILTRVGL